MMGSPALWHAAGYFGLSTNQLADPVHRLSLWGIDRGPPAAPGILPLTQWVVRSEARNREINPRENKWKLPCIFLSPGGHPGAVAFTGTTPCSTVSFSDLWLPRWRCRQLPDSNLTIPAFSFVPPWSVLLLKSSKDVPVSEHEFEKKKKKKSCWKQC